MNPPDCYASSADQEDQESFCAWCRTGPLTEQELLAEQVFFPGPMCEACMVKAEQEAMAEAQAEMWVANG